MTIQTNQIMDELKAIRAELDFIKDRMPDKEMFLNTEERELLSESHINEREGKLVSTEKLRKQLGI